MPAVRLTCSTCQNQFDSNAAPGQQVGCPNCRQLVLVPGAPPELPSWYLLRDRQQSGPYTMPQLSSMAATGQIRPADLVWRERMRTWVPAGTILGLGAGSGAADAPFPLPAGEWEPGPNGGRGGGGSEFWSTIWVCLRRAFSWNLSTVPVTDSERAVLKTGGADQEMVQQYLVWRRSMLLLVAVATSIGALITFITTLARGFAGVSAFGALTEVVRMLSQFAMPVTAILACVFWSRLRLSRLLIVVGWTVSFVAPLVIALFPLHWLLDIEDPGTEQARMIQRATVGILGGLAYFIMLMPTVLSLLPGVLRACVRLKSMFPQSVVVGWFLMAGVPFYALLLLVTFVTINQLAGNALLILGILLFMGAPVAYLVGASLFVRPLTSADELRKLGVVQIAYTVIGSLAVLCLVLYLFTGKLFGKTLMGFSSETSHMLPWQLIQLYIEFLGRSLFTTTLFLDLLLRMNHSVWYHLDWFGKSEHGKKYDQTMGQMGEVLRKL
jgi:hypothetical protein